MHLRQRSPYTLSFHRSPSDLIMDTDCRVGYVSSVALIRASKIGATTRHGDW